MDIDNLKIDAYDEKRDILIPGDKNATIDLCTRHFTSCAREAIEKRGTFSVALSGGSTPTAVYQKVTAPPYSKQIEWDKVFLFWGDERSVPPTHSDSNYRAAMEAGFEKVPIPQEQIFRMVAETEIEANASKYEQTIQTVLQNNPFDLVILGMGDDGHTASLFPQTEGLKVKNRLVIANYVPQKNTWRMSLTFEAINAARNIVVYILGENKKNMLREVLQSEFQPERYPIQEIGSKENKALWIVDEAAAASL